MLSIYHRLLSAYGSQGWWPVTPAGEEAPKYGARRSPEHQFEIAVGAILTQNTAWTNVEKALIALNRKQMLRPRRILAAKNLPELIRPAGYFNQKAARLKTMARFFLKTDLLLYDVATLRQMLLALNGVGPETADSILLYAVDKPTFIIDAYTRRIFSRLGYLHESASYDEWQQFFHHNLPADAALFNEYHALLVEHAKQSCRKKPLCEACVLVGACKTGGSSRHVTHE
ncbi:hypothetical protein HY639_05805 [Candidatus Woesearchaeota archaeon]|nr:hypothetical protein [Candidatus Woesearchaeota archaeon]